MKQNQKGQALIELIIFLPLMFMFYSMISGFANAINGSINQQKITRGYFFYKMQNNSTIPKPDASKSYQNWTTFGMYFTGWKDYFPSEDENDAGQPMAACYRITVPFGANKGDTCDVPYSKPTTQFIRVQTVMGICGATYQTLQRSTVLPVPDFSGADFQYLIGREGCLLSN